MKGGAKPYLPLPADITKSEELKQNMDFVYVSCHGVQNEKVFLVPDDTFILFRGPSGVSVPLAITEDELLNDVKYLRDRRGDNESTAAKLNTKKDEWWAKQFADIHAKNFLKPLLYNPTDPEQPKTTAVYTPGDVIQDLELHFENDRPIFFLIGIFELPMRRCVRDDIGVLNRNYFEEEEKLAGPILDTFLRANGMAAQIPLPFKEKLKLVADKNSKAPITEAKRIEFLTDYSKAVGPLRDMYTAEQYNISNCVGRGNSVLPKLGISAEPCMPLPGFQNECGPVAAAGNPLAAALAAIAAGPGGAAAPAAPAATNQITLHELVTQKLRMPGGPFQKKYKFLLIEACRALPESYLEMQELIKYGIQPKGIGFNEAATLELQAREGQKIEKAERLYRSRRYSLNTREIEGACFTTLLRLSRDRLRLLPPTPIKNKLLSGQSVSLSDFDGLTKAFRNINAEVRSLPRNKQFSLAQPVLINPTSAAPRKGIIQGVLPKSMNGTVPTKYSVRTIGANNKVQIEEIAPDQLARVNSLNLPAEQVALLQSGNLPFSRMTGITEADPRNFMTISNPYGKTFQIRTNAASKEELEAKLDEVPFKDGDDVYVKFLPQVEKAKQPFGGKKGYITSYVDYVDRPKKGRKEFQFYVKFDGVPDSKPFFAEFLTRDFTQIGKAKDMAGGGNQKLANTFCRCIKQVRRTVKARGRNQSRKAKESAAIGICVKSVLGKRGRTLKKFKCQKKPKLQTQDPK